jgi:uncharacterized membrane-anchored protein YitT (DUF2179 family)
MTSSKQWLTCSSARRRTSEPQRWPPSCASATSACASAVEAVERSRHTVLDDIQGIVAGVALVSLGVVLFKAAGIATGGVAGVAFLLHYAAGVSFGAAFFVLNLPFYVLALRRMGLSFTLKTAAAVAALAVAAELVPSAIGVSRIMPVYAAAGGGLLIGSGFLVLFRHHASLGGVGILAYFLQARHGWRAGVVQLSFDLAVLALAATTMDAYKVFHSIVGAAVINFVLAVNHKPGRYIAA